MSSRRGLLICNIGTPSSPTAKDVSRYLKEFLMDEEILNMPWLFRFFLVYGMIVPRRAQASAHNYQTIWTEEGSPLLVHTKALKACLERVTGGEYAVEIGMRYGEPSMEAAMMRLKQQGVGEVLVLPMYPQYARATTESTLKKVKKLNKKFQFQWKDLKPYYNDAGFIRTLAERMQNHQGSLEVDHLLMTYHGLPQSQLRQNPGCLASDNCCQQPEACEKNCYRAQCFATSRALAKVLQLDDSQWSISFQSRLGKAEWIRPYTEDVLGELARKGVRRLAVICPSFSADCLETLEEIAIQGRKTFLGAGGESFYMIPCLNERCEYLLPLVEKAFSKP